MQIANLQNVNTYYGAQAVLEGVSFTINAGEKLGLIGANGSGKTTILRVLLGRETPTKGTVSLASGVSVGYVPQHVERNEDVTVMEWLLRDYQVLSDALQLQETQLAHAGDAEMAAALRAYQRARDDYDRVDGDTWPQRARRTLDSLGLPGREEQKLGSLSGGEKNVVSLAQALLADPDFLVLDEPGNHLDYLGIAWLEEFLVRFRGAVLIVSHNRHTLDRVAQGILVLENGRVRRYTGGYSTYRATRLRELIAQQSDYVANQKRLAQLEALVQRFEQIASVRVPSAAWGRRLRARRSQLEREKKQAVEKPTMDESAIEVDFTTEGTRANIALQVRGYSKAYGDLTLFEKADLDIASGERVALVGSNGSGKTTLLRDVVERGDWSDRVVRVGPSIRIGYAAQEQEVLAGHRTVQEVIMSAAPMSNEASFTLLRKFLFERDDLSKRVSELSGGERNRLQLARLMAMKPNFMVLDEPTNHMDIPAREAIEEALVDYKGTILVVSHDRYFLDKVVTRVVEVEDQRLVSFEGNFSEFWRAKQQFVSPVSGRVTTRGRRRRTERVERAATRATLASLEQRIEEAEERRLVLEREATEAFARSDRRAGRRANRELDRLKSTLEDLYDQWVEESR